MLPTRLESANRNYIKNRRCVVHRRCEEQILKIRYSKDDEHNTNKPNATSASDGFLFIE